MQGRAIAMPMTNARGDRVRGNATFALQVFGRSQRESNCDCDRSMETSLLQTVYLKNDNNVLTALAGGKDTWINQFSANAKQMEEEDERSREIVEAKRELLKVGQRLQRATKDGDEEKVERLKERIAELKQIVGSGESASGKPVGVKPAKLDPVSIVTQAYLRTLSRLPTEDEAIRCREYLASSPNLMEGIKGVMWALVNTKEFIVNH